MKYELEIGDMFNYQIDSANEIWRPTPILYQDGRLGREYATITERDAESVYDIRCDLSSDPWYGYIPCRGILNRRGISFMQAIW